MLVRRAAAYSITIIIDQVQVLCCETANGAYVTKRETSSNNNTQSSSISSSASSTESVYKTGFWIAQTTFQSSSMIIQIFTLEQKKTVTKGNPSVLDSNLRRRGKKNSSLSFTYKGSYTTIYRIDMYLYVRIHVWKKMTKRRKKHPPQGDDASTV